MAKDKPLPQAGPELAEYTTAAQPKAYADGVPVFCAHDAIVPLKDLRPNPKNPNQHPPEQIKLLSSIIRATGWRGPITVSKRSGYIVKGHGRMMAAELGTDVQTAKRAGLLHDLGKSIDHEMEGTHVQLGVEFARKYKEKEEIIHAIEAHHGDVEPKTPLAFIIQACDAISAARPGARRENVESYVKRLENLEEISSSFEGVEQAFAVQAGREVRIMVKPDVIGDDQVILLARSIAKKIEDTLDYPGQIKVNVIRESRAVEYAK